jgi:phage shock protein PspC (stress-responsive transcriptional regulator)
MKKVININFQGQIIAIEEDAYEVLKRYIDSLKVYFSREEGGDEIVNDIECRIAELFGNRLKHGIPCITVEDVEVIISSIGRPGDFDADYEETDRETSQNQGEDRSVRGEPWEGPSEEQPRKLYRDSSDQIIGGVCSGVAHFLKVDPVWIRLLFVILFGVLFWVYIVLWIVLKAMPLGSNVTKRFYRNPNDRVLGGVCGGLAAYFKIDSWIPRVLFLLPLLLNPLIFNIMDTFSIFPLNRLLDHVGYNWNINLGILLVYIVLWVIIPEAKTVKQKLEMMGEEKYIQSIRDRVSDNVSGSKSRTEGDSSTGSAPHFSPAGGESRSSAPEPASASTSVPTPVRSGCFNALVISGKIVLFMFVGLFALVLFSLLIGFLLARAQWIPLKPLFLDPGYESHLLIISFCLLFGVPLVAMVTWFIRRIMKAKSRPVIGVVATVLWVGGLVSASMLASRMLHKFSVECSSETNVPLAPFSADKMYVEMLPYADDYVEFTAGGIWGLNIGTPWFLDELDDCPVLPYCTANEDSLLFTNINLQVCNSPDSLFHVRTIASARGRTLRSAKADLAHFYYPITQNDSVLFLPEFLSFPVEQGFRNQSITVEIAVPVGKAVEVSDALEEYRNRTPPGVVRKRMRRS